MGKHIKTVGAIFAFALLMGSILAASSLTADAASTSSYTVSTNSTGKYVVSASSGKAIYSTSDAQAAIQKAISLTPAGGTVILKKGQFYLDGPIVLKAKITLTGAGPSTVLINGQINVESISNVVLRSFNMQGSCNVFISAYNSDINSIVVQDIIASRTPATVSSVFRLDAQRHTISGVQFTRVSAINCDTNGFMFTGSGAGTATIRDIQIDNCSVANAGYSARYNDWVVGFALAINVDVVNMKVLNSEASGNWENGFYLRQEVAKTNVVFENCVANDNGQKLNFQEGYGFFIDSSVVLKNCSGSGNKGGLYSTSPPVDPTAPGASALSVQMSAANVEVGTNAHANGVLTGTSSGATIKIANATISLSVVLPDGTIVKPTQGSITTTGSSSSDLGQFAIDFVPTTAGSYKFSATFAGNEQYDGSSQTVSWTATAVPEIPVIVGTSSIALAMSSANVQVGQTARCTGTLTGTTGTTTSIITNSPLAVVITKPDGSTVSSTATTGTDGKFAVDYAPTVAGSYKVVVSFTGNSAYGASSSQATFTAASAPAPLSYNYRITTGGVVYDSNGIQVYSSSVTGALNWALGQAGKVTYLAAGTYTLTGNVNFASSTTLVGAGTSTVLSATTNVVLQASNVDYVTMKSFEFTGTIEVMLFVSSGTHGHHLLQDVVGYRVKVGSQNDAQFMTYVVGASYLTDVKYIRCKAMEGDLIGFWNDGDFTYRGLTKNIYYEECEASRNGLNSGRYNDWVVGYDLAEGIDVDTMTLLRCRADYNWEDGFHFENQPDHYNVKLIDCTASYNGQKPKTYVNDGGWVGPMFGAGYFMGAYSKRSTITLTNCSGTGNALGLVRYDMAV